MVAAKKRDLSQICLQPQTHKRKKQICYVSPVKPWRKTFPKARESSGWRSIGGINKNMSRMHRRAMSVPLSLTHPMLSSLCSSFQLMTYDLTGTFSNSIN